MQLPSNSGFNTVRFTGTAKEKLAWYNKVFLPTFLAKLTEESAQEDLNMQEKLNALKGRRRNFGVTLKQPGEKAFASWNANGFATQNPQLKNHSFERQHAGFYWADMQYLDRFYLSGPGNRRLLLEDKAVNGATAKYQYQVKGRPDLQVQRTESIYHHNLVEDFTLVNNSSQPVTFEWVLGTSALDIFQARWGSHQDERSPIQKQYKPVRISHSAAEISAKISHRENNHIEENTLSTRVELLQENLGNISFEPMDSHTAVKVKMTVPPHRKRSFLFRIHPDNSLLENQIKPPMIQDATWRRQMADIQMTPTVRQTKIPQVWATAENDIKQLLIGIPGKSGKTYYVPAAGAPNYIALFGRDSLITSLQMLQYNPTVAKDTLQALAEYQGKDNVPSREEEKGKILHELRWGELTRLGISPYNPYYGTVDATPLFVMVMDRYIRRTDDTALLKKLWSNVEAATEWLDNQVIQDPDNPLYGFLAQRPGNNTMQNISWKDSGNAFEHRFKDGKLVSPDYPLAPVEVQGYVHGAWEGMASLCRRMAERTGDKDYLQKAARYQQKAEDFKQRFNEKFWVPEAGFFAMALDKHGEPLPVVSADGLHALISGLADEQRARQMFQRASKEDMLSGRGMRVVSMDAPGSNMTRYHGPVVWPHLNSLVAHVGDQYGLKGFVKILGKQLLDTATLFEDCRLPELYCGFQREKFDRHVIEYPDACSPQAWASGSPFLLLTSLLGLDIDAAGKRVNFNKPVLPPGIKELSLKDLAVTEQDRVDLHIQKINGNLVRVTKTGGSDAVSFHVKY